jgi:density-regulated protein DRP1
MRVSSGFLGTIRLVPPGGTSRVAPLAVRVGRASFPASFPAAMPLEPVEVAYCSACSCPPEYCEYAGCKRAKLEEQMAKASVGDGGDGAGSGGGADGAPAAAPAEEQGGKPASDKKKKAKAKGLTITRTSRNKKKTITNVAGLEHFADAIKDVKEASKMLGKKFACGASVTKGATGKDEIDIQGDFSHEVAAFIAEKFGVDPEMIKLVDKGK